MPLEKSMLITIIAESSLESTLKDIVVRAGAPGYTIEAVSSGWGRHGSRGGLFESDQTMKMLLVVSRPVAKTILQEVEQSVTPHHAIMVFQHDVEVMTMNTRVSGSE